MTDTTQGNQGQTIEALLGGQTQQPDQQQQQQPSGAEGLERPGDPPEWLAGLPDDLKNDEKAVASLRRYSDTAALARGYLNAEKYLGGDKLPVPRDENDKEAWDKINKVLGVPEKPDQYEFKKPEKLPEGMHYDDNMEKWWRLSAHKRGVSKKQAAGLYEDYRDMMLAGNETYHKQQVERRKMADVELRRDWRENYPVNMKVANNIVSRFTRSREELKKAGILDSPNFARDLADLGAGIMPDADLQDNGSSAGYALSPNQLDAKISEFRQLNEVALKDKDHPDHSRLVDEYTKLFEMRYPERAR